MERSDLRVNANQWVPPELPLILSSRAAQYGEARAPYGQMPRRSYPKLVAFEHYLYALQSDYWNALEPSISFQSDASFIDVLMALCIVAWLQQINWVCLRRSRWPTHITTHLKHRNVLIRYSLPCTIVWIVGSINSSLQMEYNGFKIVV